MFDDQAIPASNSPKHWFRRHSLERPNWHIGRVTESLHRFARRVYSPGWRIVLIRSFSIEWLPRVWYSPYELRFLRFHANHQIELQRISEGLVCLSLAIRVWTKFKKVDYSVFCSAMSWTFERSAFLNLNISSDQSFISITRWSQSVPTDFVAYSRLGQKHQWEGVFQKNPLTWEPVYESLLSRDLAGKRYQLAIRRMCLSRNTLMLEPPILASDCDSQYVIFFSSIARIQVRHVGTGWYRVSCKCDRTV